MRSSRVSLRLATFLLLLTPATQAQTVLFEVRGSFRADFGHSIDVVGDTNGDGFGEFLVGAPYADNGGVRDAGSVQLYSGFDGSLLATFRGTGTGDNLGFGSGAAGDVNGDGFPDLCLAAREAGRHAGSVQVVSGSDWSVLHAFTGTAATGTAATSHLGWATAAVGDVDGDARDDVLVAATGSVLVFSGRDGSVLRQIFASGLVAIASAQDVNGDGLADFAAMQDRPGPSSGMFASVFSGADGSELWQRGAGLDDASLSGVLDANGDGFDDVVVGSPFVDSSMGRARLYSGPDGALLFEVFGDKPADRFGASVVGAGDLDGDGYGDFAVGMPGFDGAAGLNTGAVRAFSGHTGAMISTLEGERAGEELGSRLGGGRDVNGDGIPDVIAGSTFVVDSVSSAKVLSFVPHGLVPFGIGSPGCLGSSTLLAGGVPALGNAALELHASHTGAWPLLLIGDVEDTAGSLFLGARFHLDLTPTPPSVVFWRPLPAPDANGSVIAPFAIPNTPALQGVTFVFQVASLFPPGACGQRLATSRGLRVTIQ